MSGASIPGRRPREGGEESGHGPDDPFGRGPEPEHQRAGEDSEGYAEQEEHEKERYEHDPVNEEGQPEDRGRKEDHRNEPNALVAMLVSTSPPTYSRIESGDAKRFRKLCDQTSSRNAMLTRASPG